MRQGSDVDAPPDQGMAHTADGGKFLVCLTGSVATTQLLIRSASVFLGAGFGRGNPGTVSGASARFQAKPRTRQRS